HQDGKRYEATGERRPPNRGEWFLDETDGRNRIITLLCLDYGEPRYIYRELPDEPKKTTKNFAEVIRAKMDADPELKEAIEEEREKMRLERDHDETLLNALSLAKENDELKAEIRRLEGIIEGIARKLEELKNGK